MLPFFSKVGGEGQNWTVRTRVCCAVGPGRNAAATRARIGQPSAHERCLVGRLTALPRALLALLLQLRLPDQRSRFSGLLHVRRALDPHQRPGEPPRPRRPATRSCPWQSLAGCSCVFPAVSLPTPSEGHDRSCDLYLHTYTQSVQTTRSWKLLVGYSLLLALDVVYRVVLLIRMHAFLSRCEGVKIFLVCANQYYSCTFIIKSFRPNHSVSALNPKA
jgi:hypothetical protein